MKLIHPFKIGGTVAMAVWLLNATCGAAEQPPDDTPRYSTTVDDRAACQHQLNLIHAALQEYQKQKQSLPPWLSDLHPDFLDNLEVLICPYVKKTGNLSTWKRGFQKTVFGDPSSTYAYEFCSQPIKHRLEKTHREYKLRQMEIMGSGVPIVRCWAHRPVLNLAFDGQIYETKSDHWEDEFASSPVEQEVFHSVSRMTTNSLNAIVLKLLPPPDSTASSHFIDLTPHYNSLLSHLARMDPSGQLLKLYPEGRQKIGEVEFDIRAVVHLGAADFPLRFPQATDEIQVNRPCRRIHFLHGTLHTAPAGKRIASYFIRTTGSPASEVPIIYGKDVKTRWFNRRQKSELGGPQPAWVNPENGLSGAIKSLRLYQTTWDNPAPYSEVKDIRFVSHLTPSAPFLVAITLE